MDENKKTVVEYRSEYQTKLAEVDDVYDYALHRSEELDGMISDAKERVKAFPKDKSEHESLIQLAMESRALWEECEKRLRTVSRDAGVDRTAVARQINQSHEKADEYKTMLFDATQSMINNTSSPSESVDKVQNAANTLKTTGQVLQDAGGAMKKTGHAMTVGCTIPIIIAAVLIILLMLLF